MVNLVRIALVALITVYLVAQTGSTNNIGSITIDHSSVSHTLPMLTGATASKPATCKIGEIYFANDATAGQNLYFCTTANTWTQQLNNGAGGGLVLAGAGYGTFAALPSCTTNGQVWFFTNSLYERALCDGSAWHYFRGGAAMTLPSATSWTNVNLGSTGAATFSSTAGPTTITVPSNNDATGQSYQYTSISSSGNYTHIFTYYIQQFYTGTLVRPAQTFLSDGSKCMVFTLYYGNSGAAALAVTTYTDVNCSAGGSNPQADNGVEQMGATMLWFKVVDDGTNIIWSWSIDGTNYWQQYSAARTAFFATGATRIGWGSQKSDSATVYSTLLSYQ